MVLALPATHSSPRPFNMLTHSFPQVEYPYGVLPVRSWNPSSEYKVSTFTAFSNYSYSDLPFPPFGVIDYPVQLEQKGILDEMEKLDDNCCVFVVHIPKYVSNKGKGGGWRWHKWGQYLGAGTPTCEYLDDEPNFDDGVWTFSTYLVTEVV